MKRLLIVRFPRGYHPDNIDVAYRNVTNGLTDQFHTIFVLDDVERLEFEIVYDPHFKSEDCISGTFVPNIELGANP